MLTLSYAGLAIAGCGYVALALVLGQVFEVDDGGAADGTFHIPLFSPLSLATFCGALGAIGLGAVFGLQLSDPVSLAIAIPGAFVFTYVVTYVAWRLLASSTGSQTVRESDLVGATADVLTPIPQDGLGEVAAMVRGQRHTAPARTLDGTPVSRGTIVSVVRVTGATLIVEAETAPVRTS